MAKKVSRKSVSNESGKIPYGLVSYIIGIVAIVEAFVSPFGGIILSIVGLVMIKKEDSELSIRGKKLNIVALVLGIIFLALTIVIAYTSLGNFLGGTA
jgi:uncharacterized membrane protein